MLALRSWICGAVVVLCAVGARAQAWDWSVLSIPTRDTNMLAGDLWSAGPPAVAKPVILVQTPYNKNRYRLGELPGHTGPDFPRSTNYHVVIVDWRGFYGSTNAAKAGYNRGLDGYDCVQWIATQAWCNGQVGTWGSSALGYIQYQTAEQKPSNLVSCVIQVKDFQNRYEAYYYGGAYREEHVGNLQMLGLASTNLVLAHPSYDVFWQMSEAASDVAEEIAVPVLVVGGWYDHFPDTVLRSFADLRERSDPAVRERHRLIFGPWLHGETGKPQQGVLTYPNATNLAADTIDFWDYTIRGVSNQWATRAVASTFQMGEDVWLESTSWTGLPRSARTLYLAADGSLEEAVPGEATNRSLVYDPADPTPALGGSRFSPFDASVLEGPQDLAPDIESRDDVLVFSTPPLQRALRINGPLTVVLYVSSDRADTDFAVRLTDVQPDGRSLIMTQGIRRGRYRDSLSVPDLMTPGVVYAIAVELQNIALTIQPGHRLRIVVSSACWPHFHANRNDGGPLYTNGPSFVATNRIHVGAAQPSRVEFSVLPDDVDGDGLFDVWEAAQFRTLGRDGSGDFDGDSVADRDEMWAGTEATNAASVLALSGIALDEQGRLRVEWPSATGRTYDVVASGDGLQEWVVATNLVATVPTNAFSFRASVNPSEVLRIHAIRIGEP